MKILNNELPTQTEQGATLGMPVPEVLEIHAHRVQHVWIVLGLEPIEDDVVIPGFEVRCQQLDRVPSSWKAVAD